MAGQFVLAGNALHRAATELPEPQPWVWIRKLAQREQIMLPFLNHGPEDENHKEHHKVTVKYQNAKSL